MISGSQPPARIAASSSASNSATNVPSRPIRAGWRIWTSPLIRARNSGRRPPTYGTCSGHHDGPASSSLRCGEGCRQLLRPCTTLAVVDREVARSPRRRRVEAPVPLPMGPVRQPARVEALPRDGRRVRGPPEPPPRRSARTGRSARCSRRSAHRQHVGLVVAATHPSRIGRGQCGAACQALELVRGRRVRPGDVLAACLPESAAPRPASARPTSACSRRRSRLGNHHRPGRRRLALPPVRCLEQTSSYRPRGSETTSPRHIGTGSRHTLRGFDRPYRTARRTTVTSSSRSS